MPEALGTEEKISTHQWYQRNTFRGLVALSAVAAIFALLYLFRAPLWEKASLLQGSILNREKIQELLGSLGRWAPVVYVLFQAAQVIFAPLPGEASGGFVAGFLFGPWLGLLYSLLGLTIGSTVGFLLGRWVGGPVVARLVPSQVQGRFKSIARERGLVVGLIVFACPYFPKDYFCILLGSSGMSIRSFLIAQTLGRFPSSLLFNWQGAELYEKNYLVFFLLAAVLVAAAITAFIFKERIYRYISALSREQQ